MKNRKHKRESNFKIAYTFLILIFVAGITFLTLSVIVPSKEKGNDNAVNTVVNKTETEKQSNTQSGNTEDPTDKTPKQYEDYEKDENNLNASITMNEVNNGKYTLRVTIYELLSSGTCELEMKTNSGDSLRRSANIINTGADSSSCEGFDVLTDGISSGTYNFVVSLKSGDKTGSVEGTIKI